ncbi:hypothetical protein ABPG72_017976 [Tetrahymena utriculariae]
MINIPIDRENFLLSFAYTFFIKLRFLLRLQKIKLIADFVEIQEQYQKTLQETKKQQQQLKEIQYNEITAINPQQHLILCEVLIRIFCQDLNYYFSYVIPTYLRMIFVITGVPLNVLDLKLGIQIQNFKINQAQIFIVRITPPAIQGHNLFNLQHTNYSASPKQWKRIYIQLNSFVFK